MGKAHQFWLLLITVVLASCGTSNKFASSFGKRRYTKGFYVDIPSGIKNKVASVTTLRPMQSKHVNSISSSLPENIISNRIIDVPAITRNEKIATKAHYTINAPVKAVTREIKAAPLYAGVTKKTNGIEGSGETNYFAILGFLVCIAGVILSISAGTFSVPAIIVLAIGIGLCVYSLFLTKIYWSWLAIIGISFTVIMFVLIVL